MTQIGAAAAGRSEVTVPGRGRSKADKLARMGRILLLLGEHPAGMTTQQLLDQVGYPAGPRTSALRALHRDLATLRDEGWRIETRETANTPAVRVLRMVDNRFAIMFTPVERGQLGRAAACAGPAVAGALAGELGAVDPRSVPMVPLADPPRDGTARLAICQSAAAGRCLLSFRYSGQDRRTQPIAILMRSQGWYLRARDLGDGQVKTFALDRMSKVRKGAPGSARGVAQLHSTIPAAQFDPLAIPSGEPLRAIVDTWADGLPEAIAALSTGDHAQFESPTPGRVRLEVGVLNRGGFLGRLIELGTRVWLIGPQELRGELAQRLREAM